MAFGIQNLGVINQKNAPAIWNSPLADFPANFINGRILIDTDTGSIYLDSSSSRTLISNGGDYVFANGLVQTINPGSVLTELGGVLNHSTNIDLNNHELSIQGLIVSTKFSNSGIMFDDGTGADYMPVLEDSLSAVTPNVVLEILNLRTGNYYKVLAEKV